VTAATRANCASEMVAVLARWNRGGGSGEREL